LAGLGELSGSASTSTRALRDFRHHRKVKKANNPHKATIRMTLIAVPAASDPGVGGTVGRAVVGVFVGRRVVGACEGFWVGSIVVGFGVGALVVGELVGCQVGNVGLQVVGREVAGAGVGAAVGTAVADVGTKIVPLVVGPFVEGVEDDGTVPQNCQPELAILSSEDQMILALTF